MKNRREQNSPKDAKIIKNKQRETLILKISNKKNSIFMYNGNNGWNTIKDIKPPVMKNSIEKPLRVPLFKNESIDHLIPSSREKKNRFKRKNKYPSKYEQRSVIEKTQLTNVKFKRNFQILKNYVSKRASNTVY